MLDRRRYTPEARMKRACGLLLFAMNAALLVASDFGRNYRALGLKNGCLPEAYGFYDALRRQQPDETAEVMLLELPDDEGALYGHAVVVFAQAGAWFLWDHEAGQIAVTGAMTGREQRRDAVARSYLAAVERLKRWPRVAEVARTTAPMTDAEACARAARLLAARQPMLVEFRHADRPPARGVAFVGGGLVWVYLPELGAAFARAEPHRAYEELIGAALRTRLAGAEVLQVVPAPLANSRLAAR